MNRQREPSQEVTDSASPARAAETIGSALDEFIGQEGVRERLGIFLEAARQRDEALDHTLFAGPPGLGKTSLAGIIALEMGVGFHITSGPVLERKGDLAMAAQEVVWAARAEAHVTTRTSIKLANRDKRFMLAPRFWLIHYRRIALSRKHPAVS